MLEELIQELDVDEDGRISKIEWMESGKRAIPLLVLLGVDTVSLWEQPNLVLYYIVLLAFVDSARRWPQSKLCVRNVSYSDAYVL